MGGHADGFQSGVCDPHQRHVSERQRECEDLRERHGEECLDHRKYVDSSRSTAGRIVHEEWDKHAILGSVAFVRQVRYVLTSESKQKVAESRKTLASALAQDVGVAGQFRRHGLVRGCETRTRIRLCRVRRNGHGPG